MGAREASTDAKTVQNSAKQRFWRQNDRYSSKFKLLNSKFEFQASFLHYWPHLLHIWSICGPGGFRRRENECKPVKTSDFGAKTTVTAQNSKFWIQILNFRPFDALLTSNISHMKHLRSMGAREASTDEKTPKQHFGAKTSRYSSKFKFWIQDLNFKPLFALLISNIIYMERLRSMGAGEASTDRKTVQNSAKQCKTVILATKRPL